MKIKLCKKFTDIKKLDKKLSKTFGESSVKVKSCIGMCKQCKEKPVAKVNGKKLKGKNIRTLIDKIDAL